MKTRNLFYILSKNLIGDIYSKLLFYRSAHIYDFSEKSNYVYGMYQNSDISCIDIDNTFYFSECEDTVTVRDITEFKRDGFSSFSKYCDSFQDYFVREN
jgi:hypothetical protein